MDKNDLIVAVHGNRELQGGVYNVLSSFALGLLKGFNDIGVKSYTTKECISNDIKFNLVIGFNTSGMPLWEKILRSNIPNIMWTVDSVFAQNFDVVKQFSAYKNFILFEVTSADSEAIGKYIPDLKHGYIPHAVDLDLWKKQDVKKENDIVCFSSIIDYEKFLEDLKTEFPEKVYHFLMELIELTLQNPTVPFWQICQVVKENCNFDFDCEQYVLLFQKVPYIVAYIKKVKAVQALSDFNVKVYGNGPWEKYIKGNIKYMGSCDITQSIDIMNKSKISLHCQPTQLCLGLHERVLNASACETFSLVSDSVTFRSEFGDSLGFFDSTTFDNISERAEYFLSHGDERQEAAKKAFEIVKNRHTWANRAKDIINVLAF